MGNFSPFASAFYNSERAKMKQLTDKARPKGRKPAASQSTESRFAKARASAVSRSATPAHNGPTPSTFPIVGVGASAGGLEAFTHLLKHLPLDSGMGFVLVQHLDPQHESALTQLLKRATAMPVHEVTNNLRVAVNHVHVIPPNTDLGIENGVLKLKPRPPSRGAHHSIDTFFETLAKDQRELAIGVILSGTATDGTLGLQAIKAEGGITFAQDGSAKYDSMPRSAVAAGCVDFVLSPENIAKELARVAKHPYVANSSGPLAPAFHSEAEREADQHEGPQAPLASGGHGRPRTGARLGQAEANTRWDQPPSLKQDEFKKILLLLRNHCGVDFSLYKSMTIQRRITRRMVLNKHNTVEDYARFLRGNAGELDALYSDCLISVTSFFRNPEPLNFFSARSFPGSSSSGATSRFASGCSAAPPDRKPIPLRWPSRNPSRKFRARPSCRSSPPTSTKPCWTRRATGCTPKISRWTSPRNVCAGSSPRRKAATGLSNPCARWSFSPGRI
jgi:two-component system CheB/CheR fusion protein